MEDSWIYIDDDDNSSHSSLADSDKIDSETEAELYSKIHHEENLSYVNSESSSGKPVEFSLNSPSNDNVFCISREENASTPLKTISDHLLSNQITCDNFSNGKRKSSEINADSQSPKQNSSSEKKQKTDSPILIFDTKNSKSSKDSFEFKIDSIQNKNSTHIAKNKPNEVKDKVLLDSSDSDSNFFIEPSSTVGNDLQINLLKDADTIFLSSSSDDELGASSPFVRRNSILRNLSMPNLKMDENLKGLWSINFDDMHRSKRRSYRYHNNFEVTCMNCNRKGHTSRTCPTPRVIKCFICAGNHNGSRCPNKMCFNCHASGHDSMDCWKRRVFCNLCNMQGHLKMNCPDLWRRYHLTTNPVNQLKKAKQVKQDTDLFCWNCGQCGHFGGVCPLLHLSKNFCTWTCVISYNNPKSLLKERLPFSRRFRNLNQTAQNKHSNNISYTPEVKILPELNISNRSNEENKGSKKKTKNRLKQNDLGINNAQSVTRESNFPRTPKKSSPVKNPTSPVISESKPQTPQKLIQRQMRKLRKKWFKQFKKGVAEVDESQINQLNNSLKMNIDGDLPHSIRLQVEKRFKKWMRNRIKVLKKHNQNM